MKDIKSLNDAIAKIAEKMGITYLLTKGSKEAVKDALSCAIESEGYNLKNPDGSWKDINTVMEDVVQFFISLIADAAEKEFGFSMATNGTVKEPQKTTTERLEFDISDNGKVVH